MQRYCRVAIDSPVTALDRPFDYEIPERMQGRVDVGSVVRVNLHGRGVRAFVIELLDEAAVAKPRVLSALVSEQPLFTAETIALAQWTARRYVVPLGAVLHDAVPGRFSAPATVTEGESTPSGKVARGKPTEECIVLSTADETAFIADRVAGGRAKGVSTLVICPRVDVAELIAKAVDGSVVLHGDDRPSERAAAWADARAGLVDVVVGGRSALFVPMPRLGLVVVASAHDRSLKSERSPRLHALVVARRRARMAGASFVASSPAPPVEIAAAEGVKRIESKRGPIRPETARPRKGPVTPRLLEVVRWGIDRGSDVLVFAGRIGGVLRWRCNDCGWTPTATGVPGQSPEECTSCGGRMSARGWGHERIASALEKELGLPVARMVRGDEPRSADHPRAIVGTLAAAHTTQRFAAVCVADLDQLLLRPDFRAAEYALQTLHELAGVLAPGGRFLVQTREPEHHVVQSFTRGSYRFFLERELPNREEMGYPPYGVVVRVDLKAELVDALRRDLEPSGGRVVGAVERRGRLTALVRAPELEPLLDPLRRFAQNNPRTKIDIDPVDLS